MNELSVTAVRYYGRSNLSVEWRDGLVRDIEDYQASVLVALSNCGGNDLVAEKDGRDMDAFYEFYSVTIEVDFVPVYTTPDTPYLDLSTYNIWVVPEYFENVDVFSNLTWVVI